MTTASVWRSSMMSCSIVSVERGSSAEHGSSSSRTSGWAASARAMHSRCCWPPDSRSAGRSRSSATSSQRPARSQRPLDRGRELLAPRPPPRLLAQRVGDVVEDRHRKRVGLLEDHRHAPAQLGDVQRVDVAVVEHQRAGPLRGRGELGQAVERAQERRLAAARGADEGEHLALADRQRDLAHGELAAVGDRQRARCASARGYPRARGRATARCGTWTVGAAGTRAPGSTTVGGSSRTIRRTGGGRLSSVIGSFGHGRGSRRRSSGR